MKILWIFILIIILLIIGISLFVSLHPVFGWKAENFISDNFKNWKFQNLIPTSLQTWSGWYLWTIKNYINSTNIRIPEKIIPTEKFNKEDFKNWEFVWFWHSTILMNIDETIIMTDPVYYKASPISIWWKAFKYSNKPNISDLPNIDAVIISHDHYDHLDYQSILEIDEKIGKYLVPLWVKSHFKKWWINEEKVIEHDWNDSMKINDVNLVFTPARHFSGRWLLNWSTTLWWSWVVQGKINSVYFSWDSGYFDWFKSIGEKYWPFDIAFIENWAYDDAWNEIHMYPEQSVQAWIDLQAKNIMPIHWWKFDLALHSWYEPIERFINEAERLNMEYFHPKVWENFNINILPKNNWWEELK